MGRAFGWQDIIFSASALSPIVLLTGVLVLARLRPRSAGRVRSWSLAALVAALTAAASYTIWVVSLIGCRAWGDLCGLQYAVALVIAAYLLFFVSAGFCLLTAVAAIVPLARARRWDQLPLVGVLGVLPLAYIVVLQERWAVGAVMLFATIANSPALTATLSVLPLLIYGLFFYARPQD